MKELLPSDYQYFAENFCSREFVDAFSIFRVTDEQGADTVGRKRNAAADYSGVVFPHYNIKTGDIVEYCLKPDQPENELQPDGTYKPKYKYLFPPRRGGILYYPPNTDAKLLTDISKPVVITEGKKQLIALTRVAMNDSPNAANPHFLPVGINGVWGWKSKGKAIQQLDEMAWQFRTVYLVFDSDVQTNWMVRYARQQLALELQRRGAAVRIVNVTGTDKSGIDELLAGWEADHGSGAAVEKGLDLIMNQSKPFNGEILATICGGKVTLGATAEGRGKCRMSAKNEKNEPLTMDVFNPADAARRDKFIKQIAGAVELSESDRKQLAAELINLAATGSIFDVGAESKAKKEQKEQSEPIETSFKVLTDGRIIEQIRGGFAVFDPATGEHEITDAVEDADGTSYTPIDDEILQKDGGIFLADDLVDYGTQSELITEVENYLHNNVDITPHYRRITALYILFTYIFDKVLELPYLNPTGDAGSGKSRFGRTAVLASRRGMLLTAPSAASIFRIVDEFKPTLFVDEFNSDDSNDDTKALIQILNSGFQFGNLIPRQVPALDGKFKTKLFDGYCCKVFGSLKKSGSTAFNSRCVEIKMEKTIRNDLPFRLKPKLLDDSQTLRNKLTLWRLRNFEMDFETRLDEAEIKLKREKIQPRLVQVSIPLFALIDSDELKRDFTSLLQGKNETLHQEKQLTFDGKLIKAIHACLFDITGDDQGKETAAWKKDGETGRPIERPTEGKICELLRTVKITSMLNADIAKERDHFETSYVGKKIHGHGFTPKQIKFKSDYYDQSAIIFDSHLLAVKFSGYGLPVPLDFSLESLECDGKANKDSDLTRSKESPKEDAKAESLECVKPNGYNGNGFHSKDSKEKTETRATGKVLVDEVI